MPTSVTANTQPRKDLKRQEYLEMYRLAYRNILLDLARAGYDTSTYDAVEASELDRWIESELFSMRYETYQAMPSKLDILVNPLHHVRSGEEKKTSTEGFGPEASSVIQWRAHWKEMIHLKVDDESEIPPRIYVHFACFPETTVFKEKHFMAVMNNLHETCGVNSKDTVVIVTQNDANENELIFSRKIHYHKLNEITSQTEGNFVIFLQILELQYDLQSHRFAPPSRVLHCKREWTHKLKTVAHIEDPIEELPEMDVDDAHMVRLFAKPRQIIESMSCSENELNQRKYYVINYKEQNY